ncbi:hypothetical protein EDD85DRAFT_13869 [Armillaria nabsnona]|nr:hypothetical protein EDD85DRAFT_13869 [Armillaria nabsnona]
MISGFSSTRRPPGPTIVDTYTHLLSMFALYRSKHPEGEYGTTFAFVKGVYEGEGVEAVVVRTGSVHPRNIEGAQGGREMGEYRSAIVPLKLSSLDSFHPHTKQNHIPLPSNLRLSLRCCIHLVLDLMRSACITPTCPMCFQLHTREAESYVYLDRLPFKPTSIFCFTFTASTLGHRLLENFLNLHFSRYWHCLPCIKPQYCRAI